MRMRRVLSRRLFSRSTSKLQLLFGLSAVVILSYTVSQMFWKGQYNLRISLRDYKSKLDKLEDMIRASAPQAGTLNAGDDCNSNAILCSTAKLNSKSPNSTKPNEVQRIIGKLMGGVLPVYNDNNTKTAQDTTSLTVKFNHSDENLKSISKDSRLSGNKLSLIAKKASPKTANLTKTPTGVNLKPANASDTQMPFIQRNGIIIPFSPAVRNMTERMVHLYKDPSFRDKKEEAWYNEMNKTISSLVTEHLLTPPNNFCSKNGPYLLIMLVSMGKEGQPRKSVRDTWGSIATTQSWPYRAVNAEVKLLFVLAETTPEKKKAKSNASPNVSVAVDPYLESIKRESKIHKDILYIKMVDSYRNLTLKTLSALKWAENNCPGAKFILKTDSDTFINVPLLLDTILFSEKKLKESFLGHEYPPHSVVHRSGKWAVPWSSYPMYNYPPYNSGCAYVIGMSAVKKIMTYVPNFPMINIEDAFITGVLRRRANLSVWHLDSFTSYGESWSNCEMCKDAKIAGTNTWNSRRETLWKMLKSNCMECGKKMKFIV